MDVDDFCSPFKALVQGSSPCQPTTFEINRQERKDRRDQSRNPFFEIRSLCSLRSLRLKQVCSRDEGHVTLRSNRSRDHPRQGTEGQIIVTLRATFLRLTCITSVNINGKR